MDKEKIKAEIKAIDDYAKTVGGCSDGYCVINGRAKGMHTNGGCRCGGSPQMNRLLLRFQRLKEIIKEEMEIG